MRTTIERPAVEAKVQLELREITPELAATWLARAHPNRRLNARRILALVDALTSREWRENGETIKFDEDGLLIDGQHRLQAIIQSGVNMKTYVMRDVPRGAFDTLDIGKPRTAADTLASLGYTQEHALAAALRQTRVLDNLRATGFYLLAGSQATSANVLLTPAKARSLISDHPELPGWLVTAGAIRRAGIPGGEGFWAGTLYWLSRSLPEAEDDAVGFAERLISGANLAKDDPILVLRNRLVAISEQIGLAKRVSPQPLAALTIKGWNAFRRGERMTILKWSRGGVNRENFPIPI